MITFAFLSLESSFSNDNDRIALANATFKIKSTRFLQSDNNNSYTESFSIISSYNWFPYTRCVTILAKISEKIFLNSKSANICFLSSERKK